MKRIVSGLLYDTEKAEMISEREYSVFSEILYRTKKGRFFLLGIILIRNLEQAYKL